MAVLQATAGWNGYSREICIHIRSLSLIGLDAWTLNNIFNTDFISIKFSDMLSNTKQNIGLCIIRYFCSLECVIFSQHSEWSIHIHIGVRGRDEWVHFQGLYRKESHRHPEVFLSLIASYCGAKTICTLVTCRCLFVAFNPAVSNLWQYTYLIGDIPVCHLNVLLLPAMSKVTQTHCFPEKDEYVWVTYFIQLQSQFKSWI